MYLAVDGFYPAEFKLWTGWAGLGERVVRIIANHLLMSFGMYWLHRSCHEIPALWKIHGVHHWAKHPLSRNTYEDHWFDNFGNAVVGQTCAQILIPLDLPTLVFSRLFRIGESLEKHSGLSSSVNIFHYITFVLFPYAQMPHHHDWHHEGYKSCNFTFSSIGGVWDCVFDTRQAGRAGDNPMKYNRATAVDKKMVEQAKTSKRRVTQSRLGWSMITPVLAVLAAAAAKLAASEFKVSV